MFAKNKCAWFKVVYCPQISWISLDKTQTCRQMGIYAIKNVSNLCNVWGLELYSV